MPQVENPQLGRRHDYPYEKRDWHWGMVVNTNRCINCNTCSFACKSTWTSGKGEEYMWWMNVETEPYGGYPMGWDMRLLDDLDANQTIFEAAEQGERVRGYIADKEEWEYTALDDDQVHGEYPTGDVVESDLDSGQNTRREDELETVTAVYDFDFRPYGGTLFDETGAEADDAAGPDPDVPETF